MIPPHFIALAALTMVSFSAGWLVKGKLDAAAIEKAKGETLVCQIERERDARTAAEEAANRLAAAEAASIRLQRELSRRDADYRRKLQEARDALHTTSRECLDPALRVRLNAAITGTGGDAVPASAAATGGAAAAAAADSGSATDREVAEWALTVAQQYDVCRARIDAIRSWDEELNGGR